MVELRIYFFGLIAFAIGTGQATVLIPMEPASGLYDPGHTAYIAFNKKNCANNCDQYVDVPDASGGGFYRYLGWQLNGYVISIDQVTASDKSPSLRLKKAKFKRADARPSLPSDSQEATDFGWVGSIPQIFQYAQPPFTDPGTVDPRCITSPKACPASLAGQLPIKQGTLSTCGLLQNLDTVDAYQFQSGPSGSPGLTQALAEVVLLAVPLPDGVNSVTVSVKDFTGKPVNGVPPMVLVAQPCIDNPMSSCIDLAIANVAPEDLSNPRAGEVGEHFSMFYPLLANQNATPFVPYHYGADSIMASQVQPSCRSRDVTSIGYLSHQTLLLARAPGKHPFDVPYSKPLCPPAMVAAQ